MTAFDRIERHLPELMDELAAASVPDYFDDMLRTTTQARQRPAWSSLERWIPMGVIARPLPFRPVPWRSIAIVAALLIVAAAALLYVGSIKRVPPPFGPARNGVIVYATADWDLDSLDPVTGTTRTIVSGSPQEQYPGFSLDGTRLVFARAADDPSIETDFVAAADGSNIRPLVSGPTIKWYDESASGDRALLSRTVGDTVVQSMLDMTTGHETPLDLAPSLGITDAMFRPAHDQVIYEHVSSDGSSPTTVYLARGDGTGPLHQVALSPGAVNDALPSQDGTRLTYTTWGATDAEQGRTHVVDVDTGTDTLIHVDGSAGTTELFPEFSPDGNRLALNLFRDHRLQAVIVPVDGHGQAVPLGPDKSGDGGRADILWSPDGSEILVDYSIDQTVWLLPTDGSPGRQLDGMSWDRGITWQRLAQ